MAREKSGSDASILLTLAGGGRLRNYRLLPLGLAILCRTVPKVSQICDTFPGAVAGHLGRSVSHVVHAVIEGRLGSIPFLGLKRAENVVARVFFCVLLCQAGGHADAE